MHRLDSYRPRSVCRPEEKTDTSMRHSTTTPTIEIESQDGSIDVQSPALDILALQQGTSLDQQEAISREFVLGDATLSAVGTTREEQIDRWGQVQQLSSRELEELGTNRKEQQIAFSQFGNAAAAAARTTEGGRSLNGAGGVVLDGPNVSGGSWERNVSLDERAAIVRASVTIDDSPPAPQICLSELPESSTENRFEARATHAAACSNRLSGVANRPRRGGADGKEGNDPAAKIYRKS